MDMRDPAVLKMVRGNHRPQERWTWGGDLVGVYCETCGHPWPCPTITEARSVAPECHDGWSKRA